MTTSINLINLFNEKFTDLIKDLALIFPKDNDFKLFPTTIRLALLADEKIVNRIFHEGVSLKYREPVLKRDENFFLEANYEEYSIYSSSDDQRVDVVNKLKRCWSNFSAENRDTIWKYLKLLIVIDDKIHNKTT